MKEILLKTISDHYDHLMSKFLLYFGISASAGSVVNVVVSDAVQSELLKPHTWDVPYFAAIVGAIGGVSLIVQNLISAYFMYKEKKIKIQRLKSEQDLTPDAMELLAKIGDKILDDEYRKSNKNNEDTH